VAFLILSSLLFGFVPERALASNNYIDNIVFSKDLNGEAILTFHVSTSFDMTVGARYNQEGNSYVCDGFGNYTFALNQSDVMFGIVPVTIVGDHYISLASCSSTFHYVAGNTYTNFMINGANIRYNRTTGYLCSSFLANCGVWNTNWPYRNAIDQTLTSDDYIDTFGKSLYAQSQWPMHDTEKYYLVDLPTLTITYPVDDDEIAGTFYIEGSFTQPDPPTYAHWLQAIATPAGVLAEYPNAFYWPTNDATSSAFEIWISGLSAGYYDFYIYMKDIVGNFYPDGVSTWKVSNIHIVNDQPFSLPPYAEQPPYTAPSVFETLDPITYYTANSGYETSTAFYTTFTDIFAPVLLALGQNLMAYSANFTPSNASSTGNQMGEAVVLMRSYLSNLNSFFNNLPISQFLVLYLIALVLVVVIRLVKGLFNFFKPV
jgi:hypothetical protein